MSSVEAVDLSEALPENTSVLHVVVPGTSKRTGWQITFAGPGHQKAIDAANAQARRGLEKAARIEASQVNGRKFKPEEKTPDELRRGNVEWVVGRIIDWTPVKISQVSPDPIMFSVEGAIDLLMLPVMGPFFLQMAEFLGAEGSFIKPSATT